MSIIEDHIDKLIFQLISTFLINFYLIWLIVNVIKTNNNILWFMTIPVSFIITGFATRGYRFKLKKTNAVSIKALAVLLILFFLEMVFYLEPLIRYPFSTTGVPNKDLHDSMAYFISQNGKPPIGNLDKVQGQFILDSYPKDYLGYPNLFHSFSALLIRFGIFELHATYLAVVFGLIISSLSIYLLLKSMNKEPIISAIISGLFGVSSLRIIFGTVVSVPMFFSFSLILPAFLIFLTALYYSKKKINLFLPIMAIAVIGASYYSIFIIFFILILGFLICLLIRKDYWVLTKAIKLILLSFPLLIIVLAQQHDVFWRHTFLKRADYDPDEFSHHFYPYEKPIYMIEYFIAMFSLFSAIRENLIIFVNRYILKFFFFIMNLIFLIPIIFDLLFRQVHSIQYYKDIVAVDPNGILGGMNHELISRLGFLQPFFFIFILAEFIYIFKNRNLGVGLFILVVATSLLIRTDGLFPFPIMKETQSHFYNREDKNKFYSLPSHFYLLFNKEIWTEDFKNALLFLKKKKKESDLIYLKDEYFWIDEATTRWGSLFIKHRIYNSNQALADYNIENNEVIDKVFTDFKYLFIPHSFSETSKITIPQNWKIVYKNPSMVIYRKK